MGYVKYCFGHGFIFLQLYLFLYTTQNKVVNLASALIGKVNYTEIQQWVRPSEKVDSAQRITQTGLFLFHSLLTIIEVSSFAISSKKNFHFKLNACLKRKKGNWQQKK